MKAKVYRIMIVSAIVALAGLLIIQIYWFAKAYDLQEKQFDEKVNLALRAIADDLLTLTGNKHSRIDPVKQTSNNTYYVELNRPLNYRQLDSLVKIEFKEHDIFWSFQLTVYDHQVDTLLLGSFYDHGILTEGQPPCLDRDQVITDMDFAVTFPHKKTDVAGSLNLWTFTAFTFLLILILFAFMIVDLSKQKKLAEVKADFINNMTHELQTPIANISMASEVLRSAGGELDEYKAAKYADIIYQENQRLKFQVEHVLQTALLERGNIRLQKKEVDVNRVLEEVMENFKLRIQTRSGTIVGNLRAKYSLIFGDQFHLTNIFYNLLDNAEKYSPSNPEITITTENNDKGILVSVADKGIGIRRDAQKFIFEKFYRAASGDVHDVKGFGLGLTYVQKIVDAHQGFVKVTSEENKGSCFELFFPAQA
ncbi:MAG: sensor histidine kinase [Bacteroidota bacterium]